VPIDLAYIIRKLPTTITLTTFGGLSSFNVDNGNGTVTITNRGGNILVLTDVIVREVYVRYINLKITGGNYLVAASYTLPTPPANPNGWVQCPDTVFSPYIARIIAYLD
jgi:hypothetical protein